MDLPSQQIKKKLHPEDTLHILVKHVLNLKHSKSKYLESGKWRDRCVGKTDQLRSCSFHLASRQIN